MMRGWVVKYIDGEIISEWEFNQPFRFLPRQHEIQSVALFWNPKKYWVFSDKKHYFESKKGMFLMGVPSPEGGFIVSRSIGYYEGNKKVTWTVDESTGVLNEPEIQEF